MSQAIFLKGRRSFRLRRAAGMLAKAEKSIYADATRSVRNCSGVVPESTATR